MDQGLPAAACAGSPVWPDEGGLLGQQGDRVMGDLTSV